MADELKLPKTIWLVYRPWRWSRAKHLFWRKSDLSNSLNYRAHGDYGAERRGDKPKVYRATVQWEEVDQDAL